MKAFIKVKTLQMKSPQVAIIDVEEIECVETTRNASAEREDLQVVAIIYLKSGKIHVTLHSLVEVETAIQQSVEYKCYQTKGVQ